MQGGLGLPEREYYLSADAEDGRAPHQVSRLCRSRSCRLAGYPDPQAPPDRIIDLETKIAQAHATREESEDFAKGAQVWTRAELEQKAPGIDWAALLNAAQLGSAQKFEAYHFGADSRSSPRWSARSRSKRGRTGWPSTR